MRVPSCVWDLGNPVQFVQCLYFLWALKKHLDESFEDDFNSLDTDKLRNNVKNQKVSWRYKDPGGDVVIEDYADVIAVPDDNYDDGDHVPRAPRHLISQGHHDELALHL